MVVLEHREHLMLVLDARPLRALPLTSSAPPVAAWVCALPESVVPSTSLRPGLLPRSAVVLRLTYPGDYVCIAASHDGSERHIGR